MFTIDVVNIRRGERRKAKRPIPRNGPFDDFGGGGFARFAIDRVPEIQAEAVFDRVLEVDSQFDIRRRFRETAFFFIDSTNGLEAHQPNSVGVGEGGNLRAFAWGDSARSSVPAEKRRDSLAHRRVDARRARAGGRALDHVALGDVPIDELVGAGCGFRWQSDGSGSRLCGEWWRRSGPVRWGRSDARSRRGAAPRGPCCGPRRGAVRCRA